MPPRNRDSATTRTLSQVSSQNLKVSDQIDDWVLTFGLDGTELPVTQLQLLHDTLWGDWFYGVGAQPSMNGLAAEVLGDRTRISHEQTQRLRSRQLLQALIDGFTDEPIDQGSHRPENGA